MSLNLYRYHSGSKKEHNEGYFYGKFYFEFANKSKVLLLFLYSLLDKIKWFNNKPRTNKLTIQVDIRLTIFALKTILEFCVL